MSAAPRGTLGTVHNAAVVLRELAHGPAHHQLTDIAERSDMSMATVHRLLRSLTAAGLVEQDSATSRYGLGPALVNLAEQYLERHPVRTVAAPYLVDLRNATDATVVLAVGADDRVLVLDRIDGRDAGGIYRDASRSRPATDTAIGRLLAAHDDERWALVGPAIEADGDRRENWTDEVVCHGPVGNDRPGAVAVVRDTSGMVVAAIGADGAPSTDHPNGPPSDDRTDPPTDPASNGLEAGVRRAATAISRALGHH